MISGAILTSGSGSFGTSQPRWLLLLALSYGDQSSGPRNVCGMGPQELRNPASLLCHPGRVLLPSSRHPILHNRRN